MLSSLASVCVLLGVAASSSAPEWQADYGKALSQTRAEVRPLVVVIDNPAVADQSVSKELLANDKALAAYELCHIDVSTDYGKAVAEVFGASELPYVAIIDKTGKQVLHRHAGNVTDSTWTANLEAYKAGQAPQQVTVMKPVVESTPVSSPAIESYPSYDSFSPKPYCAKCQRGY